MELGPKNCEWYDFSALSSESSIILTDDAFSCYCAMQNFCYSNNKLQSVQFVDKLTSCSNVKLTSSHSCHFRITICNRNLLCYCSMHPMLLAVIDLILSITWCWMCSDNSGNQTNIYLYMVHVALWHVYGWVLKMD